MCVCVQLWSRVRGEQHFVIRHTKSLLQGNTGSRDLWGKQCVLLNIKGHNTDNLSLVFLITIVNDSKGLCNGSLYTVLGLMVEGNVMFLAGHQNVLSSSNQEAVLATQLRWFIVNMSAVASVAGNGHFFQCLHRPLGFDISGKPTAKRH